MIRVPKLDESESEQILEKLEWAYSDVDPLKGQPYSLPR